MVCYVILSYDIFCCITLYHVICTSHLLYLDLMSCTIPTLRLYTTLKDVTLYYTTLYCCSHLSQIIRNNEVMRRAAEKEHTILSLIRQADLEGKRNCVQLIGKYCVSCHYTSSNFPHCFHWINTKQQTEIQKNTRMRHSQFITIYF